MKRYSWICSCGMFASLLSLFLAPGRAAAQNRTQEKTQGAPAGSGFAIETAAKKKAVQDGEALPTPKLADGHVDLNGRWSRVKMVCDKSRYCKMASGIQLSNYEVFKDKNGAVHAELPLPPDHPLTGDENSRAITYVFVHAFDNDAQRAANPNKPPYKPEMLAKVADLNLHANQLDPVSTLCRPAGIPRDGAPERIVAAPGTAVFMYASENGNYWRIIPTDGRAHRTDIDPAYFGDSVGHWDGDTLVVDVNNFNDETWMGGDGWFHSDALHVVERITRQGSILHYQATVEDPNVLTRPWVKNPETLMVYTDPESEIYEQARCVNEDLGHFVNHDHF